VALLLAAAVAHRAVVALLQAVVAAHLMVAVHPAVAHLTVATPDTSKRKHQRTEAPHLQPAMQAEDGALSSWMT